MENGIDDLARYITAAVGDAVERFVSLGLSAYGEIEGDSVAVDDLDVTIWYGGRSGPATGKVLSATGAKPREDMERPPHPTVVISAGRGVVLVYAGSDFAYAVPHPRPQFFDDLLNRELPQDDPPSDYFGWH